MDTRVKVAPDLQTLSSARLSDELPSETGVPRGLRRFVLEDLASDTAVDPTVELRKRACPSGE